MRLLLVEDDRMLGTALKRGLQQDGHVVDWALNASEAHVSWLTPAAEAMPYHAVLLDLGLPDRSGLDLLRSARARGLSTLVVILTARDRIADRVAGLDAGADEYMVKPIDLDELAARLRALERRAAGRSEPQIVVGELAIDPSSRSVTRAGMPVELTPREFSVLMALAKRPGAVVSRAQLEESLYGWDDALASNTVEVFVHHLRRKLGNGAIETQRGAGYRLSLTANDSSSNNSSNPAPRLVTS
jgi:DNA-binding response OmpR family regulator